jgi:hypothetical protein
LDSQPDDTLVPWDILVERIILLLVISDQDQEAPLTSTWTANQRTPWSLGEEYI